MLIVASLLLAIQVPNGFHAEVFARGLEHPRAILALDDGTVLVSRPRMNDVIALRDRDGDGRAEEMRTAVASIEGAHGLAMNGRTLYVAGVKKIVSAERLPDGSFGTPRELVTDLPDGGQHPHRAIAVGPDGKLYAAIGSSCSECAESNPEHATLLQIDPRRGERRIFARGLRNMLGFDWHPQTRELWGTDDGASSEELNRIGDGLHYGFPLCFGKRMPKTAGADPDGTTKAKFCRGSEPATLALPPRSSPAGFAFDRDGDAFAALTTTEQIVRIRYRDGKPIATEPFAGGVRAAGVAVASDGTLFVTDDRKGVVVRITRGERLPRPMPRPMPRSMTSSASAESTSPVLSKAFHLAGLHGPDSVVHDEEQDTYFVSNSAGGFISRVSPAGRVAEKKFIAGLGSPKGMAIRGTELWIADVDKVRVFDRVTGASLRTIDLAPHGAVFLAGVVVGPDESIYVTDTDVRVKKTKERVRVGDGRIYRIEEDGDVEVAIQGDELRSPSAIAWDGLRFLVAQGYGKEVLAWNPGRAAKAVMHGPGAYDGLVVLPSGAVIVSSHHDDGLHVAFGTGDLRPLFAPKPTPAGIGFDRKRNRLLVPSLDGDWLEAWTLPPMEPPREGTASLRPAVATTSPSPVPSAAGSPDTSSTIR